MDSDKALVVFRGKEIRREWHNNEWYFSVVDVVEVLTDSPAPRQYWGVLKKRESQLLTICLQLKLLSSDGKKYDTDCANTENMFRIIQSIPSKKAEPFKRWLAKVGYERIQEIENPELAQDRVKTYYELKGYPKEWIDKRLRGIAIRQDLTDEWKNRDIKEANEFAILTNEISKATFGKTVKEYKEFKNIKRDEQNLRDNMNDWELILTMLGEKATTDITISKDSQGFEECKDSAIEGGTIAKNTRKEIEQKTGKSIISNENYLHLTEKKAKQIKHQDKEK
ncbi:MAG: phage antirepressor protein [Candidatus Altiarchaeales archaeon HGW-Altiarchaeales-1]|nr:MAG: phage antirepressor protein [Candidatus Altiarchaeales archaeon HGW-Altiarchaeales-1]